jgi:hypothetical protein
MFRSIFHNCKQIYLKGLPTMVTFSGTTGLLTGFGYYKYDSNKNEDKILHFYPYMIGYITLGIVTGIVYPISFPLCVCYVLKK